MTRQSDLLAQEIVKVGQDAKRVAEASAFEPAMVESVDVEAKTATVSFTADRDVVLTLTAVNGVLPIVGDRIFLAMNGVDPHMLTRPGVIVEGGWFSSNFVEGESGWGIDGAGNAEFNNATLRGDLTFLPDELIANGHFGATIDPWTDDGVANVDVTREVPPVGGGFTARVAKTVAGAGPAPMAHPAVPVEAGRTYRLAASIYPVIVFGPWLVSRVALQLRWLNDVGGVISTSSFLPFLPGGWNDQVAFSATAPAGAVEAEPLFVASFDVAHPTQGPAAYVDQVTCVEVSRVRRGHLEDCTAGSLDVDGDLRVRGGLFASIPTIGLIQATAQSLTNNTWRELNFDAVGHVREVAPVVTVGTGDGIIVPRAGIYRLLGTGTFASNAVGVRYARFSIYNASNVYQSSAFSSMSLPAGGGNATYIHIGGEVFLAEGFRVTMDQFQNSGGALNTGVLPTFPETWPTFSMTYVCE